MGKDHSDEELRRFTEANRQAWDEAAPRHGQKNQATLVEGFSKPGQNSLEPHSLDRLREIGVAGKSIAQLGCNNGRELLSLKNMGAGHCVGFDISAAFVHQARELAQASGHTDVEFVAADIYDISVDERAPFDIVLTTVGVLGWMPNLQRFFDVCSRLTRPGGHLFVEEIHPVLLMYEEGRDGAPSCLAYSYFREDPYVDKSGLDYHEGKKYQAKPAYSFHYTLSDIMMAAINVGLTLRDFRELGYNVGQLSKDLEHAKARPPMAMTILWERA